MNRLSVSIFILCLFLTVLGCNQSKKKPAATPSDTSATATSYRITANTAGSFTLGAAIPDSGASYQPQKKQRTIYAEGGPVEETVYIVSGQKGKLLTLIPKYDTQTKTYTDAIGEIMIHSPRYTTEEGIGVGSTLEAFIATYPNYKLWYTYVSDRYVVEAQQYPIQFLLQEADFTGSITPKNEVTPLDSADFKEGAQIQKIRIY